MLEISHAVRRKGAITCVNCHTLNGVLDWKLHGYTRETALGGSEQHNVVKYFANIVKFDSDALYTSDH